MKAMQLCRCSRKAQRMKSNEPYVDQVVVIGVSGFGREALDVLVAMQNEGTRIEIVGVVDDFPSEQNIQRLSTRGVPFLGNLNEFLESRSRTIKYVLGIGNPQVRAKLVAQLEGAGFVAFTAIHPSAQIGTETKLSAGVVVCAGAVISTNVQLRNHVHVNPNATIGHDSILEEFVSINPSAVISGEVLVREKTLVGASATILQGLEVGPSAVIGACACVTKNIASGKTVKGIPAK